MNAPAPVDTWILGAGGLLGGAVGRALTTSPGTRLHLPALPMPWHDADACALRLRDEARRFFASVQGRPWAVLWCAGAGVVGLPADALDRETAIFSSLLEALEEHAEPAAPGAVFFASSAGGVYAGASVAQCDEDTPCAPISPYGRAKLTQEEHLLRWSTRQPAVSTLVGRISNLYGPGQNLAKPQGLISQLCRSLLLGRPAHIYVPLDTRRDYLYADDCGAAVAAGLERLRRAAQAAGAPVHVRKVLASERETSIASLLAMLRRVARRPVRVVVAPTQAARLQPHAVRLRSRVWRDLVPGPRTALAVGIHRVWQHQCRLLRFGALAPSRPAAAALR